MFMIFGEKCKSSQEIFIYIESNDQQLTSSKEILTPTMHVRVIKLGVLLTSVLILN